MSWDVIAGPGIKAAIGIVEEVQRHYPRMELQQLQVLLRVVEKPGIRAADLIRVTGLSKAAMSRALRMLGSAPYKADGDGSEKHGIGLLTQVTDPFDSRAKIVAPTRVGRHLAEQIERIVGEAYGKTTR